MPGASGRGFSAIVARTSTSHAPVEPRAYDCAEVTVVRSGAVILFGEFGHRHLNVGDVILLAPCTLYGMEPEGWITATTLHLDRDFLVDQVFWQYATEFTDRFDAQRFVDTHFADPAQVLRLGEDRAGLLMPWLDELVALSIDGPPPERFTGNFDQMVVLTCHNTNRSILLDGPIIHVQLANVRGVDNRPHTGCHPPTQWLNLSVDPDATVDLVEGKRAVRAREAQGGERERLWDRFREYSKSGDIDALASLRSRETPVVILEQTHH